MTYAELGIFLMALGATLIVGGFVWWFLLKRNRSTKEMKALGEQAFMFSANVLGITPKGEPPTIKLRKTSWKVDGVSVVGHYDWRRGYLGFMLYELVEVVDNRFAFSNLAHEMTHVHRVRRGEETTEAEAEMVEEKARQILSTL